MAQQGYVELHEVRADVGQSAPHMVTLGYFFKPETARREARRVSDVTSLPTKVVYGVPFHVYYDYDSFRYMLHDTHDMTDHVYQQPAGEVRVYFESKLWDRIRKRMHLQ
jgi:hypothetical protein